MTDMKKPSNIVFLSLFIILVVCIKFANSQAVNSGQPTYTLGIDPCASTGILKSNVAVSVATATTTQLVASSAGKAVYVCAWTMTIDSSATSAASVAFEYSTVASCASAVTVLTGPMGTENAATGAGLLLLNG